MNVQPRRMYSRRNVGEHINESMDGGDYIPEIQAKPLPLRTIYPAAGPGQQHAYFPEGVKQGLEHLSVQAMTGRLDLTKGLELFGVSSNDFTLNPNDLDDAFVVGVEYEGQADPAKPLSLDDLGIHPTSPYAVFETQETVRTTA